MQGIFCGNFCYSRNGFLPCHSAGHARCYTYSGEINFLMLGIVDEARNAWHREEER